MKLFLLCIAFLSLAGTCNKTTNRNGGNNKTVGGQNSTCYKARLEIKGICMNYVIKVLDGDLTKLNLEREWKDESDSKTYNNVFALGSVCSFPDMKEGAEFYFTVTDKEDANCNVCMAYRPVPAAKNNIVVSQTPCP
jgi:hypothetical protein